MRNTSLLWTLSLIILLGSCSITKRKHMGGFHVQKKKNAVAQTNVEDVAQENAEAVMYSAKTETVTTSSTVEISDGEPEKFAQVNDSAEEEIKEEVEDVDEQPTIARKQQSVSKKPIPKKETKEREKKEPLESIGERELWAYLGFVFMLAAFAVAFVWGGYLSVIILSGAAVVFSIKGLKGKKKRLAIWGLVLSALMIGSALSNLIRHLIYYLNNGII